MKHARRSFLRGGVAVAGVALGRTPAAATAERSATAEPVIGGAPDPIPALRQKTGLKLASVETFTRGEQLSFVKVEADDGSTGWGQISTYDADVSATILHRKVASHFLGQDPAALGEIVDRVIEANYKYPWSFVCRALTGIETAVWDLLGQRAGKPVCELLGGKARPLPVYGSSMSRTITPEQEAARVARLRDERGYRAFKIRVGKVNGRDQDEWPGRTEAIVPAVRRAAGDAVALKADANSGYRPARAIAVGRLLEQHGFDHYEEPCPYWELEWTAEVAAALELKVAGGEQDNDLAQFRRMIRMHAVDVVQPDVCYLGGMVRALRVARMAEQAGLPCVPHAANRAMVQLFTLHLQAAIPNAGPFIEYSIEETPWTDGIFEPALEVKDGNVAVPSGPGWGVRVSPVWLAGARVERSSL